MGIKVLLVDDHRIFREGLRALLEEQPDVEVVGEAADGEQAVELARELRPQVVIMDIRMPKLDGIEATRRITAELPQVRVLALSIYHDGQFVRQMLQAGASGYLLKDCCHHDLARAIRTVDANLTFFSPEITQVAAAERQRPHMNEGAPPPALTRREREVLQLLAEGRTTREIASQCCVSVKTVETYRWRIRNKLKLRNLAQLTKYALRAGLTSLEK